MKTSEETSSLKKHSSVQHENASVKRLSVMIGSAVCMAMIFYFGAMNLAGLEENLSLRIFNFIILLAGIIYGLKLFSGATNNKIDYFTGLKVGVAITLAAVSPFAVFTGFYLFYNPELMHVIQEKVNIGYHLNPAEAAGAVCIEGLSSGAIITFMAMQYFKE
ncbi:MAG: hypothetical protein ACXVPN_11850 [Bacteroidia bacterium]